MSLAASFLSFLQRILPYFLVSIFIYQCVYYYDSFVELWQNSDVYVGFYLLIFSLIFSVSQLFVEIYKWHFTNDRNKRLSASIKQVLKGQAWAFITPGGWGDYYGRIHGLPKDHQPYGFLATLITRWTNAIPTITIGGIACFYYINHLPPLPWILLLFFWLLFFLILFAFFFYLRSFVRKLSQFFKILLRYRLRYNKLLYVVFLSYLRFFIFSLQFAIVFYLLGGSFVSLLLFLGILWTGYFIRQFIPQFFFANLGVKESVNIFLFTALGYPGDLVLQTTLFVSFFNHIFPALAGLFFYWKDERRFL